ncbi:MAG: RNA polymerase sigma factor RpoD/SigA [Candidatus Taylorbacteria bacterium]
MKTQNDGSDLLLYSRAIHEHPLLTEQEVVELCKQRTAGSLEAYDKLILHNLRLVIFIAKDFSNRGLELSDAIQEGMMGLMIAIQRFDPSIGLSLSGYAGLCIRNKMHRALFNQSQGIRIPVHFRETFHKIKRIQDQLLTVLDREPTFEEIGHELNKSAAYVSNVLDSMLRTRSTSIDAEIELDGDTSLDGRHQSIADQQVLDPSMALDAKETLHILKSRLEQLPADITNLDNLKEKHREVFRMRYNFDHQYTPLVSLVDIAKEFDMSKQRIQQSLCFTWRKLNKTGVRGSDRWVVTTLDRIDELESIVAAIENN